jgi:NAD(P)-dependent dehydrogenase (short-subunit alcohol dehydrogenase family)
VTQAESIAGALAEIGPEPLAGLVNNAGIAVIGPIELVPVEAWRALFEVNVIGMVAVTRAFLPLLRLGRGRIVNIGSIAGRCAVPGSSPYDSSKFAIKAITDALRMELNDMGVSVSLVEPGAVSTPLWQKTLDEEERLRSYCSPELYEMYATLMAGLRAEAVKDAARATPPDEVAKAVEHAMTASKPKTTYPVGADTLVWRALSLLPDRWRDHLILSEIRKPRSAPSK